jgi:hypothetical protein
MDPITGMSLGWLEKRALGFVGRERGEVGESRYTVECRYLMTVIS